MEGNQLRFRDLIHNSYHIFCHTTTCILSLSLTGYVDCFLKMKGREPTFTAMLKHSTDPWTHSEGNHGNISHTTLWNIFIGIAFLQMFQRQEIYFQFHYFTPKSTLTWNPNKILK